MGRMIDADDFYTRVKNDTDLCAEMEKYGIEALKKYLDLQPTAYYVDKVVEQLEKLKKQNPFINGIRDNSIEAAASRQTLDYAIEIVKAGGINEN